MKAWLINLVAKLGGFGKLWEKVSGFKTYAAGYAAILTGAAQILMELSSVNDLAGLIAFAKDMPTDPGWLAILGGLTAVGLRHSIQKATAQP